MDKKLKAKWLRALRSGKIKQGRGALLDEKGRMCCVGVLGRIVGIPNEVLLRRRDYLRGRDLEKIEGVGISNHLDGLARMNDGNKNHIPPERPKSFKQIANYIEKEIPCS